MIRVLVYLITQPLVSLGYSFVYSAVRKQPLNLNNIKNILIFGRFK